MNEFDKVLDDLLQTRRGLRARLETAWFYIGNFVIAAYKYPRNIKWAIQRVRRGYSDKDMWNADQYLASIIAGTLIWFIEHGKGVPSVYMDATMDPENPDVEKMREYQMAQYLPHAAIFAEYAKNGIAFDKNWKQKIGGVTIEDIDESLRWLTGHFTEFWD